MGEPLEILPPADHGIQVSRWFPNNIPFWNRPGFRLTCGLFAGIPTALWLLSEFIQLRGFVNLFASRLCLVGMFGVLEIPLWLWVINLRKRRIAIGAVGTIILLVAMFALDRVPLNSPATNVNATPSDKSTASDHPDETPSKQDHPSGIDQTQSHPTGDTKKATHHTSSPPPLAYVHIAYQKQVASADPDMRYGLEVLITTDKDITPLALNLIFTGEIGRFRASMPFGIIEEQQGGIRISAPNIAFIQRKSPGFTADAPIKIVVYSKKYIQLRKIESVPFSFPLPAESLRN